MITVKTVLESYKGIGPGFDFLRIALAFLIVANHSFLIVDGSYGYVDTHRLWAFFGPAVPMFFALSGFLIAGSAQRLKLKDFLLNRGMRIVPALAVDIFVSALVIVPIVTTGSLSDYFHGKDFQHYFLNIVGFIHYLLPGVFTHNPWSSQVNGSLWTVPFEIGCYALISVLMVAGALRGKRPVLIAALVCVAVFYIVQATVPADADTAAGGAVHNYAMNFLSERGNALYLYFLGGILVYMCRDSLPYSAPAAIGCGVLIVTVWGDFLNLDPVRPLIMAGPIAYLVAYIGLLPIGKLPLFSRGDYSYGVYLYAYPLQQILIFEWPTAFGVTTHFLCSAVCATLVAVCSWHLIEKPILGFRKRFSFTAHKGDQGQQKIAVAVQPADDYAAYPDQRHTTPAFTPRVLRWLTGLLLAFAGCGHLWWALQGIWMLGLFGLLFFIAAYIVLFEVDV